MNQRHNGRCRPVPLPLQYSAKVIRSDGDSLNVYLDGAKRRVEQTVNGVTTVTIWRPDLGEFYGIEWEAQAYTTHAITADSETLMSADVEYDVEWEFVATELFGPHTVDAYDVFARNTNRRRARVYVDCETHIRWKKVTFNKLGKEVLTMETTNVESGPPPASVFELPPGFRERQM